MQILSALLVAVVAACVYTTAHPFDHLNKATGGIRSAGAGAGCSASPEMEEGPYWVDGQPVRSDVREGQAGIPIYLNLILLNQTATSVCEPLVGVAADIWHTNASGYYAHFTGLDPNAPPVPGGPGPTPQTDNLTFMRGVQLTDSMGRANFITIYPGWYNPRSIHIHVEVHMRGNIVNGNFFSGGNDAYISQLFFEDSWTAQIAKLPPYVYHTQINWISNYDDGQFVHDNGAANLVDLTALNPTDLTEGFYGTKVINVDTSETQQHNCMAKRLQPGFRSYAF